MQEQNKFRYFIDGKEVDNRTDYLNATMSGDYVSYFNGDSVFSVSFNSFFAENTDNNKMIKREVNGHLSDVLKNGSFVYESKVGKNFTFDPTKPPTEVYIIDILDLGQIKGSGTRHKSQNGETHKELNTENTIENVAYLMSSKNNKQLYKRLAKISAKKENRAEDPEQIVTTTIALKTNKEQAEKIKEIVKEFNNQNSAEKENKEQSSKTEENKFQPKVVSELGENLVFDKECRLIQDVFTDKFIRTDGSAEYRWVTPEEFFTEEFRKEMNSKEESPSYNLYDNPNYLKYHSDNYKHTGIKESNGKINYEELDWDYIDSMALRMSKNIEKYPPKNWQKKMDIKKLAEASIRHARKIIQEIENDEESLQEHATALGCNGMMINYQLKIQERQKTLENFVK